MLVLIPSMLLEKHFIKRVFSEELFFLLWELILLSQCCGFPPYFRVGGFLLILIFLCFFSFVLFFFFQIDGNICDGSLDVLFSCFRCLFDLVVWIFLTSKGSLFRLVLLFNLGLVSNV